MKNNSLIILLSVLCTGLSSIVAPVCAQKPLLTVVIVIDQFAHHYLRTLKPYLKYGFKTLLDNGIVYANSYYPHALPATATGHASLNTGTYAKNHGIINNEWFDVDGKPVNSDDDTAVDAAVFSPDGFYNYGKSARNIMVDGVSDQICLQNNPNQTTDVFAISLKSRAAIGMAGKLGKALWLDSASRFFTSSKAYFAEIPDWVSQFNKKAKLNKLKTIFWKTSYPRNSAAYEFKNIDNHEFTGCPAIAGTQIPASINNKQYEDPLQRSPLGSQICLDFALECINNHLTKKSKNSMLLWVSLSSLDLVGHAFGPNALETIDMIYHLDKQLHYFMHRITKKFGKQNVLYVLTADHGIEPIPEIAALEGLPARRLMLGDWIPEINALIAKELSPSPVRPLLRTAFHAPYLYFDMTVFNKLDHQQKNRAIEIIKQYLMKKTGHKKSLVIS